MKRSLALCLLLVACGSDITQGSGGGGAGSGGGTAGSGGGEPMACPDGVDPHTSALVFDGKDDHVTMGVAPSLGLARFTVEAWVRRDGLGQAFGTGAGGLTLVPIAGKGRGENDGSTVDCNYAFGFFGDVLGADFEDMATGLNHPITGHTGIPRGEWHHVAVSYDGAVWRLYVDGKPDAQLTANATPRHDSIQHFGIGTSFDSHGTPAGRLQGALDEVRVWNRARTDAEIAGAMYKTIAQADGLVGRWALDAADGGAPDSTGHNNGTIAGGAQFVQPGAVLDHGDPPIIGTPTPDFGATVNASSVELAVQLTDPDSQRFAVQFHLRELSDADDFTIVVLPDTQYYTVEGRGLEHYFYDQTKWIMDHRVDQNIVAVIHNGDIVDNGNLPYQWTIADRAMKTIEGRTSDLPYGMPWGISCGNHELVPITTGITDQFNVHFGVTRFAQKGYYGGHYSDRNDANWITFSAGGLEFVNVNLRFYNGPADAAALTWARTVFESHPKAFGIFNSHWLVNGNGAFGGPGASVYEALRDVDSLQLMTCGHVAAEARRTDTYHGHPIHSMLADYQGRTDGGSGWLRIWRLSPQKNELSVRSYSPTLDRFETDADSEFVLPIDLSGAGGAFHNVATVDPAKTSAHVAVPGLAPGRVYEWYASVTDCAHTVAGPVFRFQTAP